MFPYPFYKIVHILGIALALTALGGLAVHALHGGTKTENRARRLLVSLHGAGSLLVLIGGFGMLARLGFAHGAMFPGWIIAKLVIWTLLSAIVMLPYRRPQFAGAMLIAVPVLVATAAWLAVYKPI